jgi:hypothetical protein
MVLQCYPLGTVVADKWDENPMIREARFSMQLLKHSAIVGTCIVNPLAVHKDTVRFSDVLLDFIWRHPAVLEQPQPTVSLGKGWHLPTLSLARPPLEPFASWRCKPSQGGIDR